MEQFQIGKFDIDASRCRISSVDYEIVVEPKVMDVLRFLYSRKGEVISQQKIFESVWPDATFNPSSVQRCIALLRKALQEDSKNPTFLVTHPKRGYSLDLPENVSPEKVPSEKARYEAAPSILTKRWNIPLLVTASLIVMMVWLTMSQNSIKKDFSKLLPVTSSEDNESYLSLSPDGKHLAFVRGDDENRSIWLKELNSGQEVQLTTQPTNYNVLGWSPNGSAIAFMHFDKTSQQRAMAYLSIDLVSLKPLDQTAIYKFPEVYVNGNQLQWSNENKIYFVEWNKESSDTWLSYINLTDGTKQRLRQSEGQEWLITLALSPNHQQIALGYEIGQNRYRIDLFDINTLETKSLVTLEDSIQGLSWHPDGDTILVSNKTILQLVNMDGSVSHIDFNNYRLIRDAQYVPGGDEIFMELRSVDVDIMRKSRSAPEQVETLVDTSSLDFIPVFSPDDKRFVFESHRTGLKQLYLYENGQQRLIFANPNNDELFGTVWLPDGKEIIAASKDKLFRINVDTANFEEFSHEHGPFYLREHFKHKEAILVSYRAEDGVTFHPAILDLSNMELTTYTASGERLVCYSMALDHQDNIYFANSREVFRLNNNATKESLWQSEGAKIGGLKVKGNSISLLLNEEKHFQITKINLENGSATVIHQGIEDGTMLTNSSHDEQQFLYLSKPIRTSNLVRLR